MQNSSQNCFSVKNEEFISAYFSPDDDVQKIIIDYIKRETKQILCASFRMTDKAIIAALLDAQKRGVSIAIVSDQGGVVGMHNKLLYLFQAGVPVYIFPPLKPIKKNKEQKNKEFDDARGELASGALMHNKFFIFKFLKTVITGSYNFTVAASKSNQENIIVIQHPNICIQYEKAFERLCARSMLLK